MMIRMMPGIAGVDIYKMDADGRAIEHWDTLQFVGNPKKRGANDRAGHSACQPKRDVLRRSLEMSKGLADLMERDLLEVFEQVDSTRRAAAIAENSTPQTVDFSRRRSRSLAQKH